MFRRWKENGREALLAMQAAVLSRMMTICSYAETVQDANWMKEAATSGGLFTEAITKVQDVFRSGYSFAIVVAVGLFVLAKPVISLLFTNKTAEELNLAAALLMTLSLSVIIYALSTLNSSILQGLGKVNTPIINAGISLVVQTVAAVLLLMFTSLDLYSIAIANTLYSGMMCVLNQWAVRRAVGYRQEIVKTFVIPVFASAFMGAAAWAIYEGLYMVTKSMRISVIPAIVIAAVVYFVMLILMRGITEQELRSFPKGYLLVKVAKKCRLLR